MSNTLVKVHRRCVNAERWIQAEWPSPGPSPGAGGRGDGGKATVDPTAGQALTAAQHELTAAKTTSRNTATHLPLGQVRPGSRLLGTERKLLTHAIRMSAYNSESALARLLRPHYSRRDDEARALLREAFTLSGDLHIIGNTRLSTRTKQGPRRALHRTHRHRTHRHRNSLPRHRPSARAVGGSASRRRRVREQVRGDQGEFDPDLVDVLVPRRQVPEAGVLAGPDPVLDAGVRPVPGFQERELPHPGATLDAFEVRDGYRYPLPSVHHQHRPRAAGVPGSAPSCARPRRGPDPHRKGHRPRAPAV